MVDITKDTVKYISEGVKIIDHHELGLILLLRSKATKTTIQRALATSKTKILDQTLKHYDGHSYYRLEEA